VAPGDAVLLMGDGVYAAIPGTHAETKLQESGAEVHLLDADATAAGICGPLVGINRIDMEEFVALTERFLRQMAWY